MTSRPFCSLYFSNLSCGTSSGAGLGAAFCVCGAAGAFFAVCGAACDEADCCPAEAIAKTKNAAAPSIKTFLSCSFIKVSFQMDTDWLNRWTTLAGVLKNLALAYLGSQGVQAFCCTRYFDGQEAARALAASVSRLQLHFADLDDGLGVRVIRNIGHDFLRVPPKTRFKCFDGIELKLSDCQIESGGAWRSAGNAVFDGHALQHRPRSEERRVGKES